MKEKQIDAVVALFTNSCFQDDLVENVRTDVFVKDIGWILDVVEYDFNGEVTVLTIHKRQQPSFCDFDVFTEDVCALRRMPLRNGGGK